jgi:hypothetical protein
MRAVFLIYVFIVLFSCKPTQQLAGGAEANDAKFIFRGTIEAVGSATMPEITDVSNCIVVKVTDVISAPPGFTDWQGKSITVSVKQPGRQKPGNDRIFYTNGWLYGKSMATLEIASQDSKEISRDQVLANLSQKQDRTIRERVRSTELIVSGQITQVGEPTKGKLDSEHDPYWTTAVIRIDSIEKGRHQGPTVTFLFASSMDVMWENAPKFKTGDKGVWLLRRTGQEPTFKVIDKSDYFPPERLTYVRSLLK